MKGRERARQAARAARGSTTIGAIVPSKSQQSPVRSRCLGEELERGRLGAVSALRTPVTRILDQLVATAPVTFNDAVSSSGPRNGRAADAEAPAKAVDHERVVRERLRRGGKPPQQPVVSAGRQAQPFLDRLALGRRGQPPVPLHIEHVCVPDRSSVIPPDNANPSPAKQGPSLRDADEAAPVRADFRAEHDQHGELRRGLRRRRRLVRVALRAADRARLPLGRHRLGPHRRRPGIAPSSASHRP